ncbi:UHRF1-binding protein 1-like [Pseudolycoriella hygida]|uniref:UHRF1-binding protein 1-like n=1 Tax=Pseudolycoriella hygida TaxID=35572 RepID=A0A9Q0S7Z9_9DIPT|nr:UHRF1-binding protein 1-like [Pseudolycoriella hygida]
MVSIIKNQLLKHLSRYTKNLSSDKINISTFGGEGELSNLQLDEKVLTELLELPGWLKLTSAWCNHVSFRISWTKLKSTPITLSLDEVNITVETCEFERTGIQTPTVGQSLATRQGKYSFIHKVIDGITVVVNTVNVNFISPAFTASVQMSRIRVESKTPKWLSGDLRVTRLKDPAKGLLLIFKELSWQTVRIEASSTQDKTLTPLRLLTNQARCRITIKKKLSDCSILSSRLVLILDDLLWVLTDSQLKAALHFVDSLGALIKEATNLTQKTKAQKKLETSPEYQAQQAQQTRSNDSATTSAAQKTFKMFDVRETSYHFFSQRIDLHLCDDAGDGRSCHPDLNDGGALQISVQGFQIDYYPFHLAKTDRSHWPKYREAAVPPALWLEQSLNSFKESLLNLSQPNRPPTHAPLERSPVSPNKPNANSSKSDHVDDSPTKRKVLDNLSKLMTACVIMRIEDFILYRVTTAGKKQVPKEFISGDKDRYSFPAELPTVHAEFTYFYFPGDFVFPLPQNKIFVHVNPVQVNFHLESVLWFNSFALNLRESLLRTSVANSPSPSNEPSIMYMDVKLEAIMPRIIFECSPDAPSQRDRPRVMQVQISRFFITNIRELGASRADLAIALHSLQEGSLVFGSGFPSKHNDLCVVTDRILSHVAAADVVSNQTTPDTSLPESISQTNLSRYALWSEPRDVWCVMADPIWVDFLGARSVGQTKSVPFVDAVPVTLWIHGRTDECASQDLPTPVPSRRKSEEELNLSIGHLEPFRGSDLNGLDQISKNFARSNPFYNSYVPEVPDAPAECAIAGESDNKTVIDDSVANDKSIESTADLHVIAHVSNLVSLQIDHYQLLFLLRLSEELTELSTFLSLDSNRILRKDTSNNSLIVGCVIPQVEVTLVMPSQTPGKESSGGDAESVIPDSASLGDDLHINNSATWSTQAPPTLDQIKNNQQNPYYYGSIETPSPITNDPPLDVTQYAPNPNTHGFNVQILSTPLSSTNTPNTPILAASTRNKNRNSVTDSGFKELGSSLISMKKGFSNFMTSIDSALKTNTSDDMSDTVSMQSDISSDSENFIHVLAADDKTADCMDVMFRLNPFTSDPNQMKASPVEVASEVCEEPQIKTNMSSPSEPSEASSWRRRDLVSMATFRLTTVEIIRQQKGCSSSLRLQISALNCDECGAIPWDELQTKFGARCRSWNLAPYNLEKPPCVQLRLDELLTPPENVGKITDKKSVLRWFSHNVEIRIKDLTLDLSMSTVVGIGDLVEDEIIAKPLPLEILLENLKVHLMEDRPPVNITSPGPVPMNLNICKMRMTRDETGTFKIQPENSRETDVNTLQTASVPHKDRELLSMQLVMQQLKSDNDVLKKQLASHDALKMKANNETDTLKNLLKKAQDDLSVLLDEKRTLMDTVRSLQMQLVSTERPFKTDGNR